MRGARVDSLRKLKWGGGGAAAVPIPPNLLATMCMPKRTAEGVGGFAGVRVLGVRHAVHQGHRGHVGLSCAPFVWGRSDNWICSVFTALSKLPTH